MSYNLSSLVAKVQSRINDASFSSATITEYLNDAQNDLFSEYDLRFMEASQTYTLNVGTADITNDTGLPADFESVYTITNTTAGYESLIPYRDFRDIDENIANPLSEAAYGTGSPTSWYMYGGTIYVFPLPDQAYTLLLRYKKRPTILTADADVIAVPQEFEELLILGATYRVHEFNDNYDQAAYLKGRYDEQARKLVNRYSRKQTGAPTIMRVNRHAVRP